ncbi:TlpA family protein disulfide reductase [Patiriisocius sp. Uisw_017]|jgi:thiol-disulfide isomerase/thioredoxin|uniref:TlpA family protein disulfide reductase n=1 Tax=Patiriisocius sp. Uisw_017 TaxID=3230968 RepID=UPI0039E9510E
MKIKTHLIIALVASQSFLLNGCKDKENNKTEAIEKTSEEIPFDQWNTMIDDPENEGKKMFIGRVTHKGFMENKVIFDWMLEGFMDAKPKPSTVVELRKLLEGVTIKFFMGTWCEDSQREIPRLFKTLQIINYDFDTVEMYAMSHDKDTPEGYERGFNIEYVPTIIFYKDGKELNRIVESTHGEYLEDDMTTILSGEPYTPMYAD